MQQTELGPAARRQIYKSVIEGARSAAPVAGLTHNFYRYPARFSPTFAKAAILAFSEPGDWVLDPFVGGGTTVVEALANGRNSVGVDISSLATFVSEAKTLLLEDEDVSSLRAWTKNLPKTVNMRSWSCYFPEYAEAGYYRNLESREFWRFRKAIEQVLASILRIRRDRVKTLARCVLLKTAQWALDSRKALPSISRFRGELCGQAELMLAAALELRERVTKSEGSNATEVLLLNRSTTGLEQDRKMGRIEAPGLVLTSPPYPGLHVLYHRWQVDGRKEAPAPFWIADRLDGAGSSYYTMGDRKCLALQTYFDQLEANFRSIAKVCGPNTTIVQMVAFSEPKWQLPKYLEVLQRCGLRELRPWELTEADGRLWREVPNRRWHARQQSKSNGAREVVLIHKKA